MAETEYRTLPFELVELKASDGGHEFTAYASTFGNVDLGGDVVMRGAFDATLQKRQRRPLLWQHNLGEPIGLEKSLKVDDRGLLGTWRLVDTARGADAYKLLKAGAIDSMSIGYVAVEAEYDDVQTRLLKQIDLLECSVVSLPMNEQATVTSVKHHLPELDLRVPFEDLFAQLRGFVMLGADEAEALRARRMADERKLSDVHLAAIEQYLAEAKASTDRLERLLADQRPAAVERPAEPDGSNWKARIAFARQFSATRSRLLETR